MPPIVPLSQVIRNVVEKYSLYVWLAALLVGLGFISYWLVHYNLARQQEAEIEEDPANYPEGGSVGRPGTVYFFHVEWCGFCSKAMPVWDRFKTAFDGRKVNGYTISCIDMNVTDTEGGSGVNPALAQQYQLKSFPTVKLVLGAKKVVVLNSSITDDALRSFLRDCTRGAA